MISSISILFLVGTLPHWTVHSASLDYEPAKITVNVNEHFNNNIGTAQLVPDVQKLSPFIPNYIHQGANFFFNPQLLVSPNHVPAHVEAVNGCSKENNTTTTKPPLTTMCTTTPEQPNLTEAPETTTEKVILADIIETINPPSPPDCINMVTEELLEITPPLQPIIPADTMIEIPTPLIMPDAPELPPLNLTVPILVEEKPEEVASVLPELPPLELPEPAILEDETIVEVPSISEIPTAPVLPPLLLPEFPAPTIIEEIHKPEPCIEEVVTIKDELFIPKPPKLFGLITSVSILEENCKPCLNQGSNVPTAVQESPLVLSDIIKPSGKPTKTIVLLPTISELPLIPIPKLPLDIVISEKSKSARLVYPTACAHNIIADRIVPNIILSENSPKHLKLLSVPAALKFPVKYRN